MKVEQNISRLKYLLSLYNMTADELLAQISKNLIKPLTKEDIFAEEIDVSHLKRIDKFFKKGLNFYLDPKDLEHSKEASIFFRKSKFGVELNIGAKKIVNQFEELKISLSAISKLAELNIERTLPFYHINKSPKEVALEVRNNLYPEFVAEKKIFLEALISKLSENNILVFEFVETWNKKETANIDGFFLNPNVIVLKRQQKAFSREIFTLAHEIGHFLLNEEEVDNIEIQPNINKLSAIERWCNDFAYYFLAGNFNNEFDKIKKLDSISEKTINEINKNTHLSKIALFTRLLYNKVINYSLYNTIKADFDEEYKEKLEKENREKEEKKLLGIKTHGFPPKPINSPLFISTLQTAFYEGVINEYEVCKKLNITPDKLERYLQ